METASGKVLLYLYNFQYINRTIILILKYSEMLANWKVPDLYLDIFNNNYAYWLSDTHVFSKHHFTISYNFHNLFFRLLWI